MDISSAILDPELGCTAFTVERITYTRSRSGTTFRSVTEQALGCIHPGTPEMIQLLPEEEKKLVLAVLAVQHMRCKLSAGTLVPKSGISVPSVVCFIALLFKFDAETCVPEGFAHGQTSVKTEMFRIALHISLFSDLYSAALQDIVHVLFHIPRGRWLCHHARINDFCTSSIAHEYRHDDEN